MAEHTEAADASTTPAAAATTTPASEQPAAAVPVASAQLNAEVDGVPMDVVMKEYYDTLLRVDLQNQVAFYFSKQNLEKDAFLRSKMDENEFVPLSLVAGFPVIKRMFESRGWAGVDMKFLATAVKGTNLRLSKDQKSVAPPSMLRTTIAIRDLPSDVQAESVRKIFDDASCPAKPVNVNHLHLWYVEFATEKDTSDVFAWLRNRKFQGQPIKGFIKSRHSGYIAAGPSAPPQLPQLAAPGAPIQFPGSMYAPGTFQWQFVAPSPATVPPHGVNGHMRNGSSGREHHSGSGGRGHPQGQRRAARRDQQNSGEFSGQQNRRGGAGQRHGDRFSDRTGSDARKGGRHANSGGPGTSGGAGANGNSSNKGRRAANGRNEGDYGSGGGASGGRSGGNPHAGGGGRGGSAAGGGSNGSRGQQQAAAAAAAAAAPFSQKPPAMTQEEFPALPTKLPAEDLPTKPAQTYSRLEVMRLMRDVVQSTSGQMAPEVLVAVAPKLVEETPRKELMPDVDPADIPEPSPIPPSPMVGANPSPQFSAASIAMGAIPELGTAVGN